VNFPSSQDAFEVVDSKDVQFPAGSLAASGMMSYSSPGNVGTGVVITPDSLRRNR
jgi:hypothetical protein